MGADLKSQIEALLAIKPPPEDLEERIRAIVSPEASDEGGVVPTKALDAQGPKRAHSPFGQGIKPGGKQGGK
jgi:hypothetical protein